MFIKFKNQHEAFNWCEAVIPYDNRKVKTTYKFRSETYYIAGEKVARTIQSTREPSVRVILY